MAIIVRIASTKTLIIIDNHYWNAGNSWAWARVCLEKKPERAVNLDTELGIIPLQPYSYSQLSSGNPSYYVLSSQGSRFLG